MRLAAVLLLAAAAGCPSWFAEDVRPNIVLVIGDDHAYPHFGFMGDPIVKTPNLDRLAEGGFVFTTAYVTASTCEPSLRSLLTGQEPFPRDPARPAAPGSGGGPVDPDTTLPGLLRRHGYASFQVGKHWLKDYALAGFTEGTKGEKPAGGVFERMMGGRAGLAVGRTTMQPVYDFIDRHRDQPFLLWFAPNLPHRPWNAPDQHRALYAAFRGELTPSTIGYYANISWLDHTIGELVRYLDEQGLRSRTLIVYLSDNGFRQPLHEHFAPSEVDHGKDSMSELGFRTPIVFNWPGRVPAGVVRSDLVSSLDLFPTLLDFAGVPIPPGLPGVDLRAAIEDGAPVGRSELIGSVQRVRPVSTDGVPRPTVRQAYFLRSPRWHYLWYPEAGTEQLFDVQADAAERHDVVQSHPREAAELRARIEAWKAAPSPSGETSTLDRDDRSARSSPPS